MHIIRVEKLPVIAAKCEVLVSEDTYRIHLHQRKEDPAHCQGFAKCIVGDKKMCNRHAQYEIFNSLIRGTHLFVRKE